MSFTSLLLRSPRGSHSLEALLRAAERSPARADRGTLSFEQVLRGELGPLTLALRPEAADVLRSAGIEVAPDELERLGRAAELIAQRGGRRGLVMSREAAFVVSVSERAILRAVPKQALTDSVLTDIDSAVVLED